MHCALRATDDTGEGGAEKQLAKESAAVPSRPLPPSWSGTPGRSCGNSESRVWSFSPGIASVSALDVAEKAMPAWDEHLQRQACRNMEGTNGQFQREFRGIETQHNLAKFTNNSSNPCKSWVMTHICSKFVRPSFTLSCQNHMANLVNRCVLIGPRC